MSCNDSLKKLYNYCYTIFNRKLMNCNQEVVLCYQEVIINWKCKISTGKGIIKIRYSTTANKT